MIATKEYHSSAGAVSERANLDDDASKRHNVILSPHPLSLSHTHTHTHAAHLTSP